MERPKSHETFDPNALADLEIQSFRYELQGDLGAKFNCEVNLAQLCYGMSEANAYHLMVVKKKIGKKESTDEERRSARIEFFQLISTAGGLGFDPYEAALADEKLDVAKEGGDKKKIAENLAKVFSVVYGKPDAVFLKPSQLLVKFADELYKELAFAMMSSPTLLFGRDNTAIAELEDKMDFEKLQKSSIKRWESLKKAIES